MSDRSPGTGPEAPFSDAAFAERAVYLPAADALVVADLHVGRDEASAVSLPLGERADLVDRLDALLDRFDPATVVVAGDVVHTFDRVTDRALGTLRALRDACEASGTALELVAGNHDAALASAWDGPVRDALVLEASTGAGAPSETTVVCHGHEAPPIDADRYVIGHVHPTIEIEGDRRPCFLSGAETYRGADVLLLPAFTRLAAGVPVNDAVRTGLDSPLLPDPAALAPIVYDAVGGRDAGNTGGADIDDRDAGKPLRFPPLGEFRELL
ncbi:metallophosphoesterase [Halorubrum sp. GN11_10-6_MGM]|uniref:metallophosphoesterase n=1 Tax=Halorubrum sp. GN11_10-6_MGM TaxID=2518112 RepID=UPI0010F75216|nr:metallophosphoesterase [Halorubrum sp. GN11_10-6_MGM]TKX73099.1 metallophosphoesterase [Halorubrum sp. GN11_10-6_MGM]